MLPGFIPRLHAELVNALAPTPQFSRLPLRRGRPPVPMSDRYASLQPLLPYFAILNNPSPGAAQSNAQSYAGKAPAFAPAALAWVGGSLAGCGPSRIQTHALSLLHGTAQCTKDRWRRDCPRALGRVRPGATGRPRRQSSLRTRWPPRRCKRDPRLDAYATPCRCTSGAAPAADDTGVVAVDGSGSIRVDVYGSVIAAHWIIDARSIL